MIVNLGYQLKSNIPTNPHIDLVSFLNLLLLNIFVESSIIEYISGSKYLEKQSHHQH